MNTTLEFNPYYKLQNLQIHKEDTCFSVLNIMMPYICKKVNINNSLELLESIVNYVKNSNIENNKISEEVEFISKSLHTPFESAETVIMLIDNEGKLMIVNNAFQNIYNYSKTQALNNYVGNFTRSVWFDKLISNKIYCRPYRYFPGKHTNIIKPKNRTQAGIIGNTWPIIDSEGKFGGAISVHKKFNL